MEAGLEEMRRKRIKAAKKAKLAKIKVLRESQIKSDTQNPLQESGDIDASIKEGLKKVNKNLMKKDERFKDVIGKISKIKKKAEAVKQKGASKKKKKGCEGEVINILRDVLVVSFRTYQLLV
ncbi:uncharacterized protein [Choristoneura fumiferana]|uniref:uncharacterized protein n=1 Tax=Choristoneura fumiferana TaxID=7141 RepID=UPI003D15C5A0